MVMHQASNRRSSFRGLKESGFTLIEIMVVVVILGILVALVAPRLVEQPNQARVVAARQDIINIERALALYQLDNGFYPSTEQGLKALVKKPTTDPIPNTWRQYLTEMPMDPWGRPYQYMNPGQHRDIDIFTYGADGKLGGTGYDAEIGNWNARYGNKDKQ
jgi:general secretion pathway protein G